MPEQPYTGPDDPRITGLRVEEFAFPGPLRDELVAAVLSGAKTSTTGLLAEYEHEGEPLPRAGARGAVVDSAGQVVAVTETTDVRVVPLGEVGLQHAWTRARAIRRSPGGGPRTRGSGTVPSCAPPSATRASPWTTRRRSCWSGSGWWPTSADARTAVGQAGLPARPTPPTSPRPAAGPGVSASRDLPPRASTS